MPSSPPPTERVLARRREIGDQIRAARKAASLTQEAVALRVDMTLAQYNRIEQAHASPLLDTLIRIADAIGVPLAHLVREEPRPAP
ncbi:helix-turn-helix domain-containing protein [Streptomyces sp. NPDC102274]|uniref:helix-turn-helix domain-containing protein n=1 Tax=Streptomyces sp. NPDC102274 TaxID=3366151 RepID=UPI00381DDCEE